MTALWISVVALGVAATIGLLLFALRIRQKVLPMPVALFHGSAAATGLVCLVIAVATGAPRLATYALLGFAAAGVGGFYLFSIHMRGRIHPVVFIVAHGGIAVGSYVLLLLAAVRG